MKVDEKQTKRYMTKRQRLMLEGSKHISLDDSRLKEADDLIAYAQNLIMNITANTDSSVLKAENINDVYKLATAAASLAKAQAEVAKIKMESYGSFVMARESVYNEIRLLLVQNPDLYEAIQDLVDKAQKDAQTVDIPT